MYEVKALVLKEVVEIKVDAKYLLTDVHNNLVFADKGFDLDELVAMVRSGVWISVKKVDE